MPLTSHTFELNGEEVALADLGLEPAGIRCRFNDGATLVLRQVKDHHRAALAPGDRVAYLADGDRRFYGRVRNRGRSTGDDSVVFYVDDALARAADVSVRITTTLSFTVGDVLRAAIEQAGFVVGEGFDALTEDSEIEGEITSVGVVGGFFGTLRQLISQLMPKQAQHRLIVNPASATDVIDAVQVYDTGEVQTVQWGGAMPDGDDDAIGRVASVDLSESIDGCYTAVLLIYQDLGGSASTFDKEAVLTSAWAQSREATWHIGKVGVAGAQDFTIPTSVDADFLVFRAWELGGAIDDFDPAMPWRFMVRQRPNPRIGQNDDRWYPIQAEYMEMLLDDPTSAADGAKIVKRYVVAHHPITDKGNVRAPGKMKGPSEAKLIYQANRGGGSIPRYTRVPDSGYEGTAYTLYGVASERRVDVSEPGKVTPARARLILDAGKDVRHTGAVTVFGQMPEWAWGGGVAVRVQGQSERGTPVLSDYQQLVLTVLGWSIDFQNELYTLDVTDDRSQFVSQELFS